MKTKPNRKEKNTKMNIVFWVMESPENRLPTSEIKKLGRKILNIKFSNIYDHLDDLVDLGLLKNKPSKGSISGVYYFPKDWNTERYAKIFEDYFRISEAGDLERPIYAKMIGDIYRRKRIFPHTLINYIQKRTDKHYTETLKTKYTSNSPKKKRVEILHHCDGLFLRVRLLDHICGEKLMAVSILKELENIKSFEELSEIKSQLIKYASDYQDAQFLKKGIDEDIKNLSRLEREGMPKYLAPLGRYMVSASIDNYMDIWDDFRRINS